MFVHTHLYWVKIVPSFTSFTRLLCCELVHSQYVSCHWMNMFVRSKHWFCAEWNLFLLCPLALWTGSPPGRKLPFNEHVCAYSFCVEWKFVPSFTSFTHLLYCELVHSQTVSCHSMNIFMHTHFVLSANSFLLLPPLPTCCVVNWCTLSP